LKFLRLARTMPPMRPRHHLRWIAAALVFGAAVLPFLVYLTGVTLLGPYGSGGAGSFYANFIGDLVRLRPAAWLLLVGPATLVLVWRMLAAYAWADDE
jgi:hypothetical protein